MGHHRNRYRSPRPAPGALRHGPYDTADRRGDDPRGSGARSYGLPRRIPLVAIFGALLIWTLMAWGAWLLADPLLAWAGGMVAPALDIGSAIGGAVGLGKEVGAVIEASRAENLARWLLGALGWIAPPAIMVIWAVGAAAILLSRRLLSRGLLSRLIH